MTQKSDNPTPAKVQPDDVPVGLMFGLLGALAVAVIVALIVLWQYFGNTADKVVAKQSLAKPSRVLKRVLRKQAGLLVDDVILDEAKGKYRIPVARAMQILVKNPNLIAPLPKPSPKAAADEGKAAPGEVPTKAAAPVKAATPAATPAGAPATKRGL